MILKQTKTSNCILISQVENPLISQIIVLLKDDVLSPQDEAVEISRAIVNNCMKRYHHKKKNRLKKSLSLAAGLVLGIAIGFFI
ncbi:MAG: hypothetical protein J6A69_02435 [Clostridia bacterium]|nr:hypothetical protein [Clostridia bacterium]